MLKKIVCMVISAFMLVSLITVFDTSEVRLRLILFRLSLVQREAVCSNRRSWRTGGSCNKFK